MAERYPVRCFILRTSNNITAADFQRWIGATYPILTFGTGNLAKEQAYIQYKKNRKTTH